MKYGSASEVELDGEEGEVVEGPRKVAYADL